MTTPTSDSIRSTFLEFFRQRGHEVVASGGLIPRNDPTLLFANAGMVQFKDTFLGEDKRAYSRATTSQKCVRMSGKHNDLDNVGKTARHHTFFEMLGNFSFGDYFKRDAITYAWDLLTKVWKIPAERLVITVFNGEGGIPADDEARAIWREVTGFGDERIIGLGRKDNFWTMGDTGPCGPCTEIHCYMGAGTADIARFGDEPGVDGAGWMEIWNLVFMQFNRAVKDGPLAPLPAPCVDTGMGLERITAVLQGVTSNYDTDLLRPLVERAAQIGGRAYRGSDDDFDTACRVIADHARMSAFSLAEGIIPDKKDRGAALRSVMRRAIRYAFLQGVKEPRFAEVVAEVIDRMGIAYPELVQSRAFILEQARLEDVRFRELLPTGMGLLDQFEGWSRDAEGNKVLPGETAFNLLQTYGFPLDLTQVIGRERGFVVDEKGVDEARQRHADVSRGEGGVSKESRIKLEHREALQRAGGAVTFTGYETERGEAKVVAIVKRGDDGALSLVDALAEGERAEVVVDHTPFYGESGGQVGDQGRIEFDGGVFVVEDTQKPVTGLVTHVGVMQRGALPVGATVSLWVHHEMRAATRRNHSATHLLHWALRKVLGAQSQQKGSKVGPEGLRFDYASSQAPTDAQLQEIEDLVNREVLVNQDVRTEVTSQAEARQQGAMMIFEEKYGDSVRMLHIGGHSVELCGGTHVRATGDIGLFKIVTDANVGAGVRRIEAVTGLGALARARDLERTVQRVAEVLKAPAYDVVARTEKAVETQRELQRQIDELKRQLITGGGGGDLTVWSVGETKVVTGKAPVGEEKAMREYADHLRDKHGRAVVVLGAKTDDGRALLVCAVSKDATGTFHAGKIIGALAPVVGGKGGGRPDMAAGGGSDGSKLDEALEKVRTIVA